MHELQITDSFAIRFVPQAAQTSGKKRDKKSLKSLGIAFIATNYIKIQSQQNYCSLTASCPQAASISLPLLRRMLVMIPCFLR